MAKTSDGEKSEVSEKRINETVSECSNQDINDDKLNTEEALDKVVPDSEIMQETSNHSILGLSELDKKSMETDMLMTSVTDGESCKKDLGVESADNSNSNGCKDLLNKDLSMSDQESHGCNGGLAAEFDLSKEVSLAIEKSQINLESEADLSENFSVERECEQVSQGAADEPMDVAESENVITSEAQQDFLPSAGSQEIISTLSSIEESSGALTDKAGIDDESRSELMETEVSHENETEQTVVMMVTDPHDDSQSVELELPDDPSYAGATLFKVPTSDGKQVLLIPFSSADGTAVLSLPPGLTLDPESSQGQPIQVALEDAATVEGNGDTSEQRYLHVPVEGGVMEELLQSSDDIQTQEKIAATSVSDLCNQD